MQLSQCITQCIDTYTTHNFMRDSYKNIRGRHFLLALWKKDTTEAAKDANDCGHFWHIFEFSLFSFFNNYVMYAAIDRKERTLKTKRLFLV